VAYRERLTYSASSALLNVICDINFVFRISFLKVSMTSNLNNYLKSKTTDVTTGRRTRELTIPTVLEIRECLAHS